MNNRYFIECVKCGISEGGMACGHVEDTINTTVRFTKDGVTRWLTNSEITGTPNFYLTEEDIFEKLVSQDFDDEVFAEMMERCFIDEFEGINLKDDYVELEDELADKSEFPAADLITYIIDVTRCSMEELDAFIAAGTNKYADEIVVPEKVSLKVKKNAEMENIFRNRIFLEAAITYPHVHDMMEYDTLRKMKKDLRKIKKLCSDDYEAWKTKYFGEKLALYQNTRFLAIQYMFIGIGSFTEVIREEQLESFKYWIESNGSAFMSEPREATKEEVLVYFSKEALD